MLRRVPLFAVCAVIALAAPGLRRDVLTNDDVLALAKAGFHEGVVIQAIRTAEARFDVSAGALAALRKAGVSDAIVQAMQTSWKERPHIKLLDPGVYVTHEDAYALVRSEPITWRVTQAVAPADTPQLMRLRLAGRVQDGVSRQYFRNTAQLLIVCAPGEVSAAYQLLRAEQGDDWREFRVEAALRANTLLGFSHAETGLPPVTLNTEFDLGATMSLKSLPKGEYGLLPPIEVKDGRVVTQGLIYTFTIE